MPKFLGLMLSAELEQWSTSRRWAMLLFLCPFALLLIAVLLRSFDRLHWQSFWQEDGPAEWTQVALLLIAVTFSCLATKQLMRLKMRLYAIIFFVASIALVFITGEEMAWGQWLLQFDTPSALIDVNYKAEMSVHNITALVAAFDFGKFLLGAYGAFAAILVRSWHNSREMRFLSLLAPPAFLASSFALVLFMRIARWTYFRDHAPTGYGELEELCLYFALAAYTWLVFRRINRSTEHKPVVTPA